MFCPAVFMAARAAERPVKAVLRAPNVLMVCS
jgi:hypothetical protein